MHHQARFLTHEGAETYLPIVGFQASAVAETYWEPQLPHGRQRKTTRQVTWSPTQENPGLPAPRSKHLTLLRPPRRARGLSGVCCLNLKSERFQSAPESASSLVVPAFELFAMPKVRSPVRFRISTPGVITKAVVSGLPPERRRASMVASPEFMKEAFSLLMVVRSAMSIVPLAGS